MLRDATSESAALGFSMGFPVVAGAPVDVFAEGDPPDEVLLEFVAGAFASDSKSACTTDSALNASPRPVTDSSL
jgi:hypothetical protein